jgi:thioredoxin-dependent peroxiredoxin
MVWTMVKGRWFDYILMNIHSMETEEDNMTINERLGLVTMSGNPLTLLGPEIALGDKAPAFELTGTDLSTVSSDTYDRQVRIIFSVPSLDTHVCDLEAQRFNREAGKLKSDMAVILVSMDLPFAQKRWADQRNASNLVLLSDHRDASFGQAYGVLVKDARLLARAVFVVDREGFVRYVELVKELTNEPDYDKALKAAQTLL